MKKINIPFIVLLMLFLIMFSQNCKKLEIIELTKIKTGTVEADISSASVSSEFIDIGSNVTEYGHCWSISPSPTTSDLKDSKSSGAKKGTFTNELSNLDPSTTYYVRPFATDNGETIYGNEINFTTLINNAITINSNLSGVVWQMGTTQEITWNDNISENVNIELLKAGDFIMDIANNIPSDGLHSWSIPTDLTAGTDFTIKITSVSNSSITGESAQFTISEADVITISTPTSSDVWDIGSIHDITWTDNITENVNIELFKGDVKITNSKNTIVDPSKQAVSNWSVSINQRVKADTKGTKVIDIENNIPSNGLYSWTLPTGLVPGTDYTIRITSVVHDTIFDESSQFEISSSYPATLFMIGASLGSWYWSEVDLPMVPVHSHPELFWRIVWIEAGVTIPGFKFAPAKEWVNDFGVDAAAGATNGVYSKGDDNVPDVATSGYYMVVVDLENETIEVNEPTVYGIGNVFGGWGEEVAANLFTVDNAIKLIRFENLPAGGDIRMYATASTLVNAIWWQTEFNILNGKIIFRGIGDDQELVSATAGQNVSLNFKTLTGTISNLETGTVTDYNTNTYNTVKIGNQWWMAENLKASNYDDGTAISLITDNTEWANLADNSTDKAYCNYNNNTNSEAITYGALYTWAAAMNGASSSTTNPSNIQGACPAGWHLPSDAEWKEMEMYLGMSQADADGTGYRGSNEGEKLREAGTAHWNSPNTGANNESGFTALPGGGRGNTDGGFFFLGSYSYWWTASENLGATAMYRSLTFNISGIGRSSNNKSFGYSVRCVKD